MLEGQYVVVNAVVQGVEKRTFGLLIGDKIRYGEIIFSTEISEDTVIVRKEIAQKMKEEIGEVPTGPEERPPTEFLGRGPAIGRETIKKFAIRAKVPWDKLSELVRGVFTPLRREGAQISLEVKIEAQSDKGISRDTLDLKIKETLKQIGAEVLEEKEE